MSFSHTDLVKVKKIKGKGRGVFAQKNIEEGTIIEKVPLLVMPEEDIYDAFLADYVFEWGKDTVAIALGSGSLYNHSYDPNARYQDVGTKAKEYVAVRDIQKGEEITINYNGDPADKTKMPFDVHD